MNLQGIINKFRRRSAAVTKPEPDAAELYEFISDQRNPFLDSLKELTPDDIAPMAEKPPKTMRDRITSLIYNLFLIISVCVFVVSITTLIRSFIDYKRADDLYGQIAGNIFDEGFAAGADRAVSLSPMSNHMAAMPDYYTGLSDDAWDVVEGGSGESYNIKFQQMKANLTHLRTINPEIYGYIHVDGTTISYPIVQSDDNDYYLDHAYTGDYMVVGSIFADCRAKENIEDNRNTVFYGHNINTGIMFNNVTKFFDKEVFDNTLIEIYTFDAIYYFKPFSIYDTVSTYQYFRMSFKDDADFVAFCEEMHANSDVKNDTTFTGDDQIITLSTCTNIGKGRYALQAKLVKVER